MNSNIYGCFFAIQRGYQALNKQEDRIKSYKAAQCATLLEILNRNASSEYGRLYGFSEITSPGEYADTVPLSTYRVYRPYVQRLMAGDAENLLCSEQLTGWAVTSATSGNRKYIPQNKTLGSFYETDFALRALALSDSDCIQKTGQPLPQGRVLLLLNGAVSMSENAHGAYLPVSSIGAVSLLNLEEHFHDVVLPPVSLLSEAAVSLQELQYLYLRFALPARDIIHMVSIYDDSIMGILQILKGSHEALIKEIEDGSFRKDIPNIDLEKYKEYLKADPVRAAELREIMQNGLQPDTLHRIWPQLRTVTAAKKAGVFLADSCITDYLKDISYDNSPYGATEGLMGVSAALGDDRFALLPHICYYEFIPEAEIGSEAPHTLTMDELEDGALYELVITNRAGLYRYRIGDLIRVTGRKYGCPLFSFEGRNGVGIDLVCEKSPESALRNAFTVAAVHHRIPITGCSMYGEGESFRSDTGTTFRYVVQFETTKSLTDADRQSFAMEIDHQIQCIVKSYAAFRKSGQLLPLRVEQVSVGTYAAFEARAREKARIPEQYKRPFIMKIVDEV